MTIESILPATDVEPAPVFSLSDVPHGTYCYEILAVERSENGPPIIRTRSCPYWTSPSEGEGQCRYLGLIDLLLGDQIKLCGINDPDNVVSHVNA